MGVTWVGPPKPVTRRTAQGRGNATAVAHVTIPDATAFTPPTQPFPSRDPGPCQRAGQGTFKGGGVT